MLWYKSWVETRLRLWIALGSYGHPFGSYFCPYFYPAPRTARPCVHSRNLVPVHGLR